MNEQGNDQVAPDRTDGPDRRGPHMARGMGIGLTLGVAIGVAMGNIAVGVGIGVALGAALGAGFASHDVGDDEPSTRSRALGLLVVIALILLVTGLIAFGFR